MPIATADLANIASVNHNFPLIAMEQAKNTTKNRTLPCPIAAQQTDDFAGMRMKAGIIKHLLAAISKGEGLHVKSRYLFLSFLSKRYIKKGWRSLSRPQQKRVRSFPFFTRFLSNILYVRLDLPSSSAWLTLSNQLYNRYERHRRFCPVPNYRPR